MRTFNGQIEIVLLDIDGGLSEAEVALEGLEHAVVDGDGLDDAVWVRMTLTMPN